MSTRVHGSQAIAVHGDTVPRAKQLTRVGPATLEARATIARHLKAAIIDDPSTSISKIAIKLGLDDKTVGAWLNGEAIAPVERLLAAAPKATARALRAIAAEVDGSTAVMSVEDCMALAAEESGGKFKVRRERKADNVWTAEDHYAYARELHQERAALDAAEEASAREAASNNR
jgi:hypothetical protein